MRGLGLGILVSFTIAATAGDALAQPGVTPVTAPAARPTASQPLAHVEGEKSEGTALALSLGVTVAGIALTALADDNNNSDGTSDDGSGGLALVGGLAMWFGPTTGHWYAGRAWTGGLTARFVGAGAFVLGAVMVLDCIDSCSDSDTNAGLGVALLYGGSAAMLGGAIYDVATAPRSVQRHNQRLRERSAGGGWAVTPTLGHGRAGFALAGSF